MSHCTHLLGVGATVFFPETYAKKIRARMLEIGVRRTRVTLGVGDATLEAACGGGRMRAATCNRLIAKLDALDAAKGATT